MTAIAKTKRIPVTVVDGWVQCPVCKRNRRLLRVSDQTRAEGLLTWCRSCKHEITLEIDGERVEWVYGWQAEDPGTGGNR